MKVHGNTGKRNAAKDDTLTARLAFRCSQEERDYVLDKASEHGSVTTVMRKLIQSAMQQPGGDT